MFFRFLLTATAIGAVTAQVIVDRGFIERRDITLNSGLPAQCTTAISAAQSVYAVAPTIPDLLSATQVTEPCMTPFYTGSAASEWSSFTSALSAWYTSNSAQLNAVITACSEQSLLDQMMTTLPASCSTVTGAQGGATATPQTSAPGSAPGSASAPQTGTPTGTASGTSSTPTGAASRETGFAAAAVAAAGFVGAVAML